MPEPPMTPPLTSKMTLENATPKPTVDFYQALREVEKGNRVTKVEWANPKLWGELKDGKVQLHKEDDRYYSWILSDGDLAGTDWIVIKLN
jgi:hypothetical protein